MTNDTICALSTPAGGAIGIVRVSGEKAIDITDSIFNSKGKSLSMAATRTIHFGNIIDGKGDIIDEVLVSIFRAPHSYTGEDVIEISCHGSDYILSTVLQTLIDKGCRQALPGEFTQRAFLSGKMDLSQAEAVADLIASKNKATHDLAIRHLKGNFSNELSLLRERLLKLTSLLELELDFSDHEELEFADRDNLLDLTNDIENRISALIKSFATGNAVKKGIPVAIIGKTNVGKSTLLNLLVGEERAIVSDIHGTTRDVIEDTTDINGVTFRFIDTAGIRDTDDTIERLGIKLTYKKMDEARIVLWLTDALPLDEDIENIKSLCGNKKLIIVNNKIDIKSNVEELENIFPSYPVIGISAKEQENISLLKSEIYKAADISALSENEIIITSVRHYDALVNAYNSLNNVKDSLLSNYSNDLICEDLRLCLHYLGEITGGEITTSEVLGNIFNKFCVGK